MEKDNPPFKQGDVVHLNSAPHIPLTVNACQMTLNNEWKVYTNYWDETTKAFKHYNVEAGMLSKSQPEPPEEEPKKVGYQPPS